MESSAAIAEDPNYNIDRQGLIDKTNKCTIPLYCVDAVATIDSGIAGIKYTQFYFNDKDEPIEAEHVFPTNTDWTFSHLKATIGEEVLTTKVVEKKAVKETYTDASNIIDPARSSSLFPLTNDMMSVQLGRIPANTPVFISCVFQQIMRIEDLSRRIQVPVQLQPKQVGDLPQSIKTETSLEKMIKMSEPLRGSKLKQKVEKVEMIYSSSSFLCDFVVKIKSKDPITRVISPTHQIEVKCSNAKKLNAEVSILASELGELYTKDFKLLYRDQGIDKPNAILQTMDDMYALMISMLVDCTPEKEWQENGLTVDRDIDLDPTIRYSEKIGKQNKQARFTFVIDRSSSMGRTKMGLAKEALMLYIKSLPLNCTFNIMSFGKKHRYLFNRYALYLDSICEKAIERVKDFKSNYGRTHLYECLETLYSEKVDNTFGENHVILLTDGLVLQPDDCYEIIKKNSDRYILNTFAIGRNADKPLLEKCAQAAGGQSFYVDDKCSKLKEQIISCLSKSLLHEVKIEDSSEINHCGRKLLEFPQFSELKSKPFAHGKYLTYFVIFNSLNEALSGNIDIDWSEVGIANKNSISLSLERDVKFIPGDSIFKMASDHYIKTNSKFVVGRKQILGLSDKFQISSEFTSLIAVNNRNKKKKIMEEDDFSTRAKDFNEVEFSGTTPIRVKIKTFTGKKHLVHCYEETLISELLEYVSYLPWAPDDVSLINLIFNGTKMRSGHDKRLCYYEVKNMETIQMQEIISDKEGLISCKPKSEISTDRLVELQKHNGSWDAAILELFDVNHESVKASMPKALSRLGDDTKSLSVMYTWLGLDLIEKYFPSKEGELSLITEKGTNFIECITDGKLGYDDIHAKVNYKAE